MDNAYLFPRIPDDLGSPNRTAVQMICFTRSTKTGIISIVSKYRYGKPRTFGIHENRLS